MPVILNENEIQMTLIWTAPLWDTGNGATVLGFRHLTDLDPVAAVNDVVDAVETNLLNLTTDTVTLTEVRWATDVEGGVVSVGTSGSLTSTVAAPNSTMLLRKVSTSRGRRGRGRAFWPQMVSETEVDEGGVIDSGRLAAINAGLDGFTSDIIAASLNQVILQNSEGISAPITPSPLVAQFVCDGKVATQRRRLRR